MSLQARGLGFDRSPWVCAAAISGGALLAKVGVACCKSQEGPVFGSAGGEGVLRLSPRAAPVLALNRDAKRITCRSITGDFWRRPSCERVATLPAAANRKY
jgi:hypothetical protein